MAKCACKLRSPIAIATIAVLSVMTVLWLVKSGLGMKQDWLYYTFGWPYTAVIGIINVDIIYCLSKASYHSPDDGGGRIILNTIKLVTLLVPTVFALFFNFGVRMMYDVEKGWWSRVVKNILIIIGVSSVVLFSIYNKYQYMRNGRELRIDKHKWSHILIQLACFYGMVDAISYSIFANDRFQSFGEMYLTTGEGFYQLFMFSMAMNGMMWFRLSHEFYALFHHHTCEIQTRQRDLDHHKHGHVRWTLMWLIWLAIAAGLMWLEITDRGWWLAVNGIFTAAFTLLSLLMLIYWLSRWRRHLWSGMPKLDHEHWYYLGAYLIANVAIWYSLDYDDNLEVMSTVTDVLNLFTQVALIWMSIPHHYSLRIALILFNTMELMMAIMNEMNHNNHMYHMYESGEKVPIKFVALSFLAWSIIETYAMTIEMHLTHLVGGNVINEDLDSMPILDEQEED